MRFVITALAVFLYTPFLFAQNDVGVPAFIRQYLNVIKNENALKPLFKKLNSLEKDSTRQISIIHIGDSHLQAGFISNEMRTRLQQRFGNAGRGLIFPYKLALSNSPQDIQCKSSIQWRYNRVAHPEIPLATGISGFCLSKENATGTLSLSLKEDTFTNLQLFFLRNSNSKNALYSCQGGTQAGSLIIASDTPTVAPVDIELYEPASSFTLMFPPESRPTSTLFFGLSATTKNGGVIYHSIGVNGARYNSYNQSEYFFKQLAYLPADLYIVSLGTNEAQKPSLSAEELENDIASFYASLKQINPNAMVLLTTPASSFYNNRIVNTKMQMVRNSIVDFATKEALPYWDLFSIAGGNTAHYWRTAKMMANDGVHYNGIGYTLQGQLLFNAFQKAYNDYVE